MNSQSLIINEATEAEEKSWDTFVSMHPGASFFHLYGWARVIEAVYRYKSCYLMARRGEEIVGVLPLIDVKSSLLGRNLISTAFTVGGGIAAMDEEARASLAAAAKEAGRRSNAGYVELRSASDKLPGWDTKTGVYAGFEKAFSRDEDVNLKEIPRRRRAEIRKGLKAVEEGQLSYEFGADATAFYSLYAQAMRDHGTPIFPQRFIDVLLKEFSDNSEILMIYACGEPVLGLLSFHFRNRIMPYYFGARADARAHRAYDLAIWLQMRRGAELGASVFDFGRSKYGSGSFDYKVFWGFEPQPLEYQYALLSARKPPNVNPDNPKFFMASKIWRKLPLPFANAAGPLIARHLA